MDPKVWGKLLTLHRRGYGVDVEALRDPPAESRKRPHDGISWVQKVAVVEDVFRGSPRRFQGIRVYIGERSRSVEPRGAHEGGGTTTPLGHTLLPRGFLLLPWRPLQVSWITFVPKITLLKVSFRLDSIWYSFSAKHWNRKNNNNFHWAFG